MEKDPLEYTNLINEPQYANVAEQLRMKVDNWMKETNDPLLQGAVPGTPSDRWAKEAENGRAYIGRNK